MSWRKCLDGGSLGVNSCALGWISTSVSQYPSSRCLRCRWYLSRKQPRIPTIVSATITSVGNPSRCNQKHMALINWKSVGLPTASLLRRWHFFEGTHWRGPTSTGFIQTYPKVPTFQNSSVIYSRPQIHFLSLALIKLLRYFSLIYNKLF